MIRSLFKLVTDYQVEETAFQDAVNLMIDRLERMTEIIPMGPYSAGA